MCRLTKCEAYEWYGTGSTGQSRSVISRICFSYPRAPPSSGVTST